MREDFTRKSQIYTGDMEKDIRTPYSCCEMERNKMEELYSLYGLS